MWMRYQFINNSMYIRVDRKKNMSWILAKFDEMVYFEWETTQKNFEPPTWEGRGAGGPQSEPPFEKNAGFCVS